MSDLLKRIPAGFWAPAAVVGILLGVLFSETTPIRISGQQANLQDAQQEVSLVVVVILAPRNAEGENVARDQGKRGLSL